MSVALQVLAVGTDHDAEHLGALEEIMLHAQSESHSQQRGLDELPKLQLN